MTFRNSITTVALSGTVPVTGTVNVGNSPTVNVGNSPTVSVGNSPAVTVGNTVSVTGTVVANTGASGPIAPALRSGSTTSLTDSTGTVTLTTPSSISVGDLLVAVAVTPATGQLSLPAGWTLAASRTFASPASQTISLAYRVATSADVGASYPFGNGIGSGQLYAGMLALGGGLTNVNGSSLANTYSGNTAGTVATQSTSNVNALFAVLASGTNTSLDWRWSSSAAGGPPDTQPGWSSAFQCASTWRLNVNVCLPNWTAAAAYKAAWSVGNVASWLTTFAA